MAKLPPVLGTDDLPLAELCAARLDGELFAIDGAWSPIDEPDLPAFRAAVVARRSARALVIERLSAAWVHGALDVPPAVAHFCVPASSRVAVVDAPGTIIREVRIGENDIVQLGGVACTTVLRTAFDLLRDPTLTDVAAVGVVVTLLHSRSEGTGGVRALLEQATRMPHRSAALSRLRRVESACASAADTNDRHGESALSRSGDQPSLTR